MQKYFFVLGKNPTLSIVEIISVLKRRKIQYLLAEISREIAVFLFGNPIDVLLLMKMLGGTVKIGEILDEVGLEDAESKFQQIFTTDNLLEKYLPRCEVKLHIGVSIYNAGGDTNILNFLFKRLKELNITIKNNLQSGEKKVGFVRIKARFLSSVSVVKNQLVNKGVEIILILTKEKIMVGKTLVVQEFESFSLRDYGRPERDKKSGILPPKLARMMINLGEVEENTVILDPFCGSGTILQEAIILGYKNIVGSDISARAISDTKRNIDWLFQNFQHLDRSSYNIKILQTDIRLIAKYFKQNSIDAVVTEPYLGPPFYQRPGILIVKRIFSEVGRLYLEAFSQLAKILKARGRVVIVFPVFAENNEKYFLEIIKQVEKLGFRQRELFPAEIRNLLTSELTSRNTILYGSYEQFVRREIVSFQKDSMVY